MNPEDTLKTLRDMRRDLTNLQQRLSEVIRSVAELPASQDSSLRCPTCGVKLRGQRSLAEHLYYSHDGSEPPHFVQAELAAGIRT